MKHISDALLERLLLDPAGMDSATRATARDHLRACRECAAVWDLLIGLHGPYRVMQAQVMPLPRPKPVVLAAASPVVPVAHVDHLLTLHESGLALDIQILTESPSGDWLIYLLSPETPDMGPVMVRLDPVAETILLEPGKGTRIPHATIRNVNPVDSRMRAQKSLFTVAHSDTTWVEPVGDVVVLKCPSAAVRSAYYTHAGELHVADSPGSGTFLVPLHHWKPGIRVWFYG